jgi:hypothetical protein
MIDPFYSSGNLSLFQIEIIIIIMCPRLHFNICKETGLKLNNEHWYNHVPKSVETNYEGKVAILWNQKVQTDKTLISNKPDIIICDNKNG